MTAKQLQDLQRIAKDAQSLMIWLRKHVGEEGAPLEIVSSHDDSDIYTAYTADLLEALEAALKQAGYPV